MIHIATAFLAALTLTGAKQSAVETETISLKSARPTRVLQVLKGATTTSSRQRGAATSLVPFGIKSISAADSDMTLKVRGTAPALEELKQIVGLLDVAPARMSIRLRLIRVRHNRGGTEDREQVLSNDLLCSNNLPVHLVAGDEDNELRVDFTPRINGDGTVTVVGGADIVFQEARAKGLTFSRRFDPAQTVRLAGAVHSPTGDPNPQSRQGNEPSAGVWNGYFLEVGAADALKK